MASNKAIACITDVKTDSQNNSIVVYKLSYTKNFNLDLQEVIVDLNATIASINNSVQTDAMNKINLEMGAGTIANKNDVRLASGFVS